MFKSPVVSNDLSSENTHNAFKLKKSVLAAFLAILAIAVLIFILIVTNVGGSLSYFYSPYSGSLIVLNDGERLSGFTPQGGGISSLRSGKGGERGAVLMSKGSSYSLYGANLRECYLISENVGDSFISAYSKDVVAYINENGALLLYSHSSKKSLELSSSAEAFALSPKGLSVLYSVMEENILKLYLYSAGKSTFIANDFTPLAISDDGSFICALGGDGSLCLLNPDGTQKARLGTGISDDRFYLSEDMSAIVFSDGAYTYISVNGAARVRLAEGVAAPISLSTENTVCDSREKVLICPSASLIDACYLSLGKLYYIDENLSRTHISDGVLQAISTKKGIYLRTSDGSVIRSYKGETVSIATGSAEIFASLDGKYLYTINSNSELHAYKGSKTLHIASGVVHGAITSQDLLMFITSDRKLYTINAMRDADLKDENVFGCFTEGAAAFYMKDYSRDTGMYTLYASDGSEDFSPAAEKIMINM